MNSIGGGKGGHILVAAELGWGGVEELVRLAVELCRFGRGGGPVLRRWFSVLVHFYF